MTFAMYPACDCGMGMWWDVARIDITPEAIRVVEPEAKRVTKRYEDGIDARTRFIPKGWTQWDAIFWPFLCEWAVAEMLGLPWNKGDHRLPDVGTNVEVRATHRDEREIVVYPGDDQTRKFVLATGDFKVVTLHGWAMGRDIWDRGIDHPWAQKGPKGRGHWLEAERLHRLPFHRIRSAT